MLFLNGLISGFPHKCKIHQVINYLGPGQDQDILKKETFFIFKLNILPQTPQNIRSELHVYSVIMIIHDKHYDNQRGCHVTHDTRALWLGKHRVFHLKLLVHGWKPRSRYQHDPPHKMWVSLKHKMTFNLCGGLQRNCRVHSASAQNRTSSKTLMIEATLKAPWTCLKKMTLNLKSDNFKSGKAFDFYGPVL